MAPRSSVRPDDRERDGSFRSHRERSVDLETVRTVLRNHPVRLAVLFGSQATGSADGRSDVDLAIELETHEGKRTDLYMRVLTDLSIALDRDDIDLALVEDLKPRVGLATFTHGKLLVGSDDRMRVHRERFERRVERLETSEPSPGERFDAALERIGKAVRDEA